MSRTPRYRYGRVLLVCFAALAASIPLALPVFSDPIPEPPRVARSQIDAGTPDRLVYNATGTGTLADLPAITGLRLLVSDASGLPVALAALDANRVLRSDASGFPIALAAITADRALVSDGSGYPTSSSVTATEVGYLSGASSNLQTQISAQRTPLTANTTFYVATTGSDTSNLCTSSGSPCLTVQRAIDVLHQTYDLRGYTATIDVENGTYTGAVSCARPFTGSGVVTVSGDTGTPSNVSFTGAGTFTVTRGCDLQVEGIKFSSSTQTPLAASYDGGIHVTGAVEFGSASGQAHIVASNRGRIVVQSNYTISGNATQHIVASLDAYVQISGVTVTLSGTPAFSTFADVRAAVAALHSVTWSGSATGQRYNVTLNGAINTYGAGTTYLPGDTAGGGDTGGNYD